jgi:hypothetical protein
MSWILETKFDETTFVQIEFFLIIKNVLKSKY